MPKAGGPPIPSIWRGSALANDALERGAATTINRPVTGASAAFDGRVTEKLICAEAGATTISETSARTARIPRLQ
ncbi:hypothetical protein BWD40_03280 [Sphingopyxis granuli]|nr:hypothetical protein BWD40_03280 [Sphingopyxis granuli]